jgi:hypothetical protein
MHPVAAAAAAAKHKGQNDHPGGALSTFVGNALSVGRESYDRKAKANPHGGPKPYDEAAKDSTQLKLRGAGLRAAVAAAREAAALLAATETAKHPNLRAPFANGSSDGCGAPVPVRARGEPSDEVEEEAPCACAFDPAAPSAYSRAGVNVTTDAAGQDWAGMAGSGSSGGGGLRRGGRTMVFASGGMALGNALLGYLTTYHDALRTGRVLVLHKGGLFGEALGAAFDLGLPWASKEVMRAAPSSRVKLDYSRLTCPRCVIYTAGGLNTATVASTAVAHSRARNFHFDKSAQVRTVERRRMG